MSRGTVCLTFDFDAISLWIARGQLTPGPISRGEFGAYAINRILELLRRNEIPATFFIPGHTLETYPAQCSAIAEAEHEIALHGYVHESVSTLNQDAEIAINRRSAELIERCSGRGPIGHRTPSFDFTEHTVAILTELGVEYDSSLMGTDFEPYLARIGDVCDTDGPFRFGQTSSVLELPVSWTLDDYPHLEYVRQSGFVMPGLQDAQAMFRRFLRDVQYMADATPNGVTTVTLHPQVVGRGARMFALEQFVTECRELGVAFERCAEIARRFRPTLMGQ